MRYYANRSKKEKGTLANLTFTPAQEKEVIRIAGHLGLLLMERYMALGTLTNPNLEDKTLATMLDVSERTIRAARTKLTKAGWFRRTTSTIAGETHIMYDIGPQAVKSKSSVNINLSETKEPE